MHIRRKKLLLLFTTRIAEEEGVGVEIDFVVDDGFVPLVLLIELVLEVVATVDALEVALEDVELVVLVVELLILSQTKQRNQFNINQENFPSSKTKTKKPKLTSNLQQPTESPL